MTIAWDVSTCSTARQFSLTSPWSSNPECADFKRKAAHRLKAYQVIKDRNLRGVHG